MKLKLTSDGANAAPPVKVRTKASAQAVKRDMLQRARSARGCYGTVFALVQSAIMRACHAQRKGSVDNLGALDRTGPSTSFLLAGWSKNNGQFLLDKSV